MKIIVVAKNRAGGGARDDHASQATRYIAESARDELLEGKAPRPLFNATDDRLGTTRANRWLGGGAPASVKDLLHLVVSLADERDYLSLGENEKARQAALRAMTRSALAAWAETLQAENLRWCAGIHRNTDHPHLHVLLRRAYTERETGRAQRLNTLPAGQRARWAKAADGTRAVPPGTLQAAFEKLLAERLAARERPPDFGLEKKRSDGAPSNEDERRVLGEAWLARERVAGLQQRYAQLAESGARQRVKLRDPRGRVRMLSEYELDQRARARAAQIVERGMDYA